MVTVRLGDRGRNQRRRRDERVLFGWKDLVENENNEIEILGAYENVFRLLQEDNHRLATIYSSVCTGRRSETWFAVSNSGAQPRGLYSTVL